MPHDIGSDKHVFFPTAQASHFVSVTSKFVVFVYPEEKVLVDVVAVRNHHPVLMMKFVHIVAEMINAVVLKHFYCPMSTHVYPFPILSKVLFALLMLSILQYSLEQKTMIHYY